MRRPLTLSQILASLPPPPFWRQNGNGTPTHLTLSGKGAVSILEQSGFDVPKILATLDLRMTPEEFAEFRTRSSITDADLHRKHAEHEAAVKAGTWRPSWTGRAAGS